MRRSRRRNDAVSWNWATLAVVALAYSLLTLYLAECIYIVYRYIE